MTRRHSSRPKLSEADLWKDGPPARVADVARITGYSRKFVVSSAESGALAYIRAGHSPNSPYLFQRREVLSWLDRIGWNRKAS